MREFPSFINFIHLCAFVPSCETISSDFNAQALLSDSGGLAEAAG
jgi:hypothetical protein